MPSHRPPSSRAALLALAAVLSVRPAAAVAPPPPSLTLGPCAEAGLAGARCGTFEVFENRAAGSGRKLALKVIVLPATGPRPAADAVVFFSGGPGESVTANAAGHAGAYKELRRERDLLLVDVRGTGGSHGLDCPQLHDVQGYLDAFLPTAGVEACRVELEKSADLRFYTTANAVDDVDDVRAALGYETVDLVGGSYGTRAALVYLQRHPARVRSAVLEGVVPTDTRMPLTFAQDAQAALDAQLAACARDEKCHAAFPDPAADLRAVLTRLEAAPATLPVEDRATGEPRPFRLSRNALAQTIRYMLYTPSTAALVPLYVHLAAQGNLQPLGELAVSLGQGVTSMSDGFFLSVTCAEDVPRFTLAEAAAAARGTFLGDFRARRQKDACVHWRAGAVVKEFYAPVTAAKPVLLIVGDRDPVTPVRWAAEAARHLPHGKLVVVPGAGHSLEGLPGADCIERLVVRFLEQGSEQGLDADSCIAKITSPPFALSWVREAAVELPAEALRKIAGAWEAEDGPPLTVDLAAGRLRVRFARDPFRLTPVSPTRFRIEGAPGGYYLTLEEKPGEASRLVLEEGPATRTAYRRKG